MITENKHLKEVNAGLQTENRWLKSELDAVYKGVKSFVQENFRTVKEAMQRVTDHVKGQVSFTTTFEKKNQEDNKRQSKSQPKPKQNDFDLDL